MVAHCDGTGKAVHAVFTFDCWTKDAEKFEPVWDIIIESVLLDRFSADPTKGEVLH